MLAVAAKEKKKVERSWGRSGRMRADNVGDRRRSTFEPQMWEPFRWERGSGTWSPQPSGSLQEASRAPYLPLAQLPHALKLVHVPRTKLRLARAFHVCRASIENEYHTAPSGKGLG